MPIIRVSGYLGAGKTKLCQKLSRYLNYGYSYAGAVFREMAAEHGMSIEDFYSWLEGNPEMEKAVDERQAKLMQEQDNFVVEGRIAPFLPAAFKRVNLLLTVDTEVGYQRQLWRPENIGKTLDQFREKSDQRVQSERERYLQLYGIEDHLDPQHFDIVLDTSNLNEEEVLAAVIDKLTTYL